jgi:1,5-anhydro-D-fructose reductase (1,5-anhydro-D-mannitol-forming)
LFAEAVKGNGRPSADGVDGIKSLAVAIAVKKTATSGQSVRVEYGGF